MHIISEHSQWHLHTPLDCAVAIESHNEIQSNEMLHLIRGQSQVPLMTEKLAACIKPLLCIWIMNMWPLFADIIAPNAPPLLTEAYIVSQICPKNMNELNKNSQENLPCLHAFDEFSGEIIYIRSVSKRLHSRKI